MACLRYSTVAVILLQMMCLSYGAEEEGNEQAGAMGVSSGMVTDHISALNFLTGRGWAPSDGSASELIDFGQLLKHFQMYAGLSVTGVLDDATKAKMNSPKCGNPDFGPEGYQVSVTRGKRFTTLGSTWPQNEITWFLEGVTSDLAPSSTINSELAAAFQYWEDVSALSFREVRTDDADIIVNFFRLEHGDGNPFDGRGTVLAHAFGPGRGRGGDMHFDDDEMFTASRGINLQQVAVHEIGHSLGLGHSSDNTAIMAPFYQFRENLQLGSDDITGIQSLYGPPTNTATRPPIPTNAPTQATVTTPTPPRTLAPIFCNGQFDAATGSFDGAVYLFQGSEVFKVRNFRIESNYPRPIAAEFPGAGVPSFVDAAFLWTLNEQNQYMYIFKGNQYWRIYNGVASQGYPRSISAWGLPGSIDGAFRWPGNERIYFFKGNEFYRYNTMSYRIDTGYPRPITSWPGVISPLAAVLDFSGQSYFFNGQFFQVFSTSTFTASANLPAAGTWLGCQTEGLREYNSTTEVMTTSGVQSGMIPPSIYVIVLTSILGVLVHLST